MATVSVCSGRGVGDGDAVGAAVRARDGAGLGALAQPATTMASSATIHPRRTPPIETPVQLQSRVARYTRPTAELSSLTATTSPDCPSGVFRTRYRVMDPSE